MSAESKTVLIADDDASIRDVLLKVLQHAGYGVMEAHDGEHALQLMRQQTPDLLLLDIMMPELDGLAVIRAMRADPALDPIPVIAFTALTSQLIEKELFDLGVRGFMRKPLHVAELRDMVEHEFARLAKEAALRSSS